MRCQYMSWALDSPTTGTSSQCSSSPVFISYNSLLISTAPINLKVLLPWYSQYELRIISLLQLLADLAQTKGKLYTACVTLIAFSDFLISPPLVPFDFTSSGVTPGIILALDHSLCLLTTYAQGEWRLAFSLASDQPLWELSSLLYNLPGTVAKLADTPVAFEWTTGRLLCCNREGHDQWRVVRELWPW